MREKNRLQEKVDAIFQENKLLTETSEKLRKQLTVKEQKFEDFRFETFANLEKVLNAEKQVFRQKLDELQAETNRKLTEMEQSFETLPIRKMSIPRSDQKDRKILLKVNFNLWPSRSFCRNDFNLYFDNKFFFQP